MAKMYVILDKVLSERNMTQKQLAELTGLRPATISEICKNQRTTLNKEHLNKIANVLNITDITHLIEFKIE
ncbi:TPA: helix-turn-helix transcriptional regulator [Bacillus cereus]|nr:helix-turn-helix transcriptional regulator [Bacillus cereus]